MAGVGRRSGWPLTIHMQHMLRHRVEGTTFLVLTTISDLIIIKTSSATFINPTQVWILEDLQKQSTPYGSFCITMISGTKTSKLIKTMARCFDFNTCKYHRETANMPLLICFIFHEVLEQEMVLEQQSTSAKTCHIPATNSSCIVRLTNSAPCRMWSNVSKATLLLSVLSATHTAVTP